MILSRFGVYDIMKAQRFYSRANENDIDYLFESFRKGHFFVERKSDNKWLTAMVNPNTLKEDDWTNDPLKAMDWSNKPLAEAELIRMKLGDSAIVTEHEFIDPK